MDVQKAIKQSWERLGFNGDAVKLPAGSLYEMWQNTVEAAGNRPAFSCLGQSLTYGDIDLYSNCVAAFFQKKLGLQQGDKIAIQLPNLLQYPITVIAAWKAGLVIVNTNPMYTSRELEHQLNDAQVKAVIVMDRFYNTLVKASEKTSVKHIVVTRPIDLLPQPKQLLFSLIMAATGKREKLPPSGYYSFKEALSCREEYTPHSSSVDDVAVLQYTGGTTGVSKGVMLTQRNLLSNTAQVEQLLASSGYTINGKTIISPLPLYHIFAFLLNMGLICATRGHSVLIPDPRNIKALVKAIKPFRFDVFCGLNSLFVALVNNKAFCQLNFSNLSYTISGGMPLMKSVASDWQQVTGCTVSEGYGLTESSPVITMNPPGKEKIGYAGIALPQTEVKVVNSAGVEQPVGETGELCIRGPQVMKGYWQRAEQTAETIVDGWLHTGDVVAVDEDGYIRIVDRIKDMILVSGFNVYPNEVEDVLTQHPKVLECAAIGIPDERSGEAVKMFVVSSDNSLTEQEVIAFCKAQMAAYKAPDYVEFREDLPKSNVGKVLRKELKAEEMATRS